MSHKKHRNLETNEHHLMPKSRGGNSHKPNVEEWRVTFHDALHRIFSNQHTIEKIRTILELDKAILTEGFRKRVEAVLDESDMMETYKPEAFETKKKHKKIRVENDKMVNHK